MKHLKMFVFTAVAVLGLVAFAGATVAQATVLYTNSGKTVSYPTGTTIDLSLKTGTSTKLTSGGSTIATCTGSTAKGKTTNEAAITIAVEIETLNWSGCERTTDTVTNGKLEIKWTSGTSGEVIGKESEWTQEIFGVSCTYGFGAGTTLGTITGGSEPLLNVSTTIRKTAGGFLCPGEAGWDAEYVFTEPHALYVGTVTPTSLFTDKAQTTPYSTGTVVDLSLESGSTMRFTSGGGGETITTCTGSTARGKASHESGEPTLLSLETLTWSGCGATTDTLTKGSLEIKGTSGGNGEVIGKESQWTLGVFGTSCSYGFGEGIKLGTLTGGETPTLKIEALVPRTAGGVLCPAAVTWDANYVVTEPHALYVGPTLLTSLYTDSGKSVPYADGTTIDLSLKAGTSTKLTSGGSTIATCTGSTAKGKAEKETSKATPVSLETLTWSGCEQTTDTVANGKLEIKGTSGGNGEVIGKNTEWTLKIFGVSCTYGFGGGTTLGTITGGSEPLLNVSTTISKTAGGFLCPFTAGWDAEYVFTEPHAIFVG